MRKSILVLCAVVTLAFIGCEEKPYIEGPGSSKNVPDSIPATQADTSGIAISVDSAIAICNTLSNGQVTAEIYKLTGVLTTNITDPLVVPSKYTNINFELSDNGGKTKIACYYINNLNNKKFTRTYDVPCVGTRLTVRGPLTNYNGKPELKDGYIAHIDSMVHPEIPDTIYATCAEAKEAALKLENNVPSKEIYVIEGYVQVDGYDATISKGQQKFFWIADTPNGGKVFEAYYCNVPGGNPVPKGAKVRLTGKIMKYNTTAEMKNGDTEILEVPN